MKGEARPPAVATLGLIGDIHAEDRRLAACLHALREAGAELLLATGDIVDGRGDANRCCALLEQHGVLCVRGNHDRWVLRSDMRSLPFATELSSLGEQSRRWLSTLPPTRSIETLGGPLLLGHGTAEQDMMGLAPDDEGYALACNDALTRVLDAATYRLLVGGHTHRRMLRRFDDLFAINPGALCDARYAADPPGFALLELSSRRLCFYDFIDDETTKPGPMLPLPI